MHDRRRLGDGIHKAIHVGVIGGDGTTGAEFTGDELNPDKIQY